MKKTLIFLAATIIGVTAFAQQMDKILSSYMQVKDALVKSDSKSTGEFAITLRQAIEASKPFSEKESLLMAVHHLQTASGIEQQRVSFADVSMILWKVIRKSKDVKQEVYYLYCPMKKMFWMSNESEIRNPYYGSKMLTCGNVKDKKDFKR
jgi:hypothetical protein